MFDAPMDGLVCWTALGLASLAVAGVALSLAAPPPPDAAALAEATDEVATSPYRVADAVRIRAAEIRVAASQVSLRGPGGAAHASLVAGAATPAWDGRLRRVLDGGDPADAFEGPAGFRRALAAARERWGGWRPAPDRLRIRHVSWRGVDGTLVG